MSFYTHNIPVVTFTTFAETLSLTVRNSSQNFWGLFYPNFNYLFLEKKFLEVLFDEQFFSKGLCFSPFFQIFYGCWKLKI